MLPPIFLAERRGRQKAVFLGAIGVLLAAQVGWSCSARAWFGVACGALLVFFAGFNLLEASLPSLVSRRRPPAAKGTAIGVYSSVQFLGAFVGASAGGFISQHSGPRGYSACAPLLR